MMGGGVVGGGVVEILAKHAGVKFNRICVRDASKARDFKIPEGCEVTTNVDSLLQDDIDCVVEVAGGTTIAYDLMLRAMAAGKSVVTANKAAISLHLDELSEASTKVQAPFLYEAAVCGGIPIINTIQSGLRGDSINRIVGIMNGTTNYILSRMEKEGVQYLDVLKDAQDLGYAEADPAADVEGWDARSKLCILAKLSFGHTLDEQALYCQGLTRVSKEDFEYAAMMDSTIKLLGVTTASEEEEGGTRTVKAYLSPMLIKKSTPIASASGATNLISLNSKHIGESVYMGAGAGRWPTAQSVVADILRIGAPYSPPLGASADARFERDFESRFYLRCVMKDQIGAIARLTGLLADAGISVFSILQTPITDRNRVACAVVTDECRLSQVEGVISRLTEGIGKKTNWSKRPNRRSPRATVRDAIPCLSWLCEESPEIQKTTRLVP